MSTGVGKRRPYARPHVGRLNRSLPTWPTTAHFGDYKLVLTSAHARLSPADTEAVGGALGGFIGPVVFGGGGGVSSAGSTASRSSSRDVAGTSLNQARDRTLQAASSVRSQRATVVQSARQGESVRVQTDVVANHNHCHALTIEYFEVLRHFQVSQELAHVQECLFVPFELTPFTAPKALRHRDALLGGLRRPDLARGFDALERVRTGWADADVPGARYADQPLMDLDGELWMTMSLHVRRTRDDGYDAAQWAPYTALLSQPPDQVWTTYMGVALPIDRDKVWNTRLAPRIVDRLVNKLTLTLSLDNGTDIRAVGLIHPGVSLPARPAAACGAPAYDYDAGHPARADHQCQARHAGRVAGGRPYRHPFSLRTISHGPSRAGPRADAAS